MKDMVTYLSPYQLKKLKSTLQDKLEDVVIKQHKKSFMCYNCVG